MDKIQDKIRELRISKNLTQQQLADKLFVTKQTVSKWEKGKSVPDITSIDSLASFFGVSVDYLVNSNTTSTAPADTTTSSHKNTNRLTIILLSALIFMFALVVALCIVIATLVNNNSSTSMVTVHGLEFTFMPEKTTNGYFDPYIRPVDNTLVISLNVYNSNDYPKECSKENFGIDNKQLKITVSQLMFIDSITIPPHEDVLIEIVITSGDIWLSDLDLKCFSIKYAGSTVASLELEFSNNQR